MDVPRKKYDAALSGMKESYDTDNPGSISLRIIFIRGFINVMYVPDLSHS